MRILFLDLDTLRPDHLGCYGYVRNTSPNIDSVARQGVRFDQLLLLRRSLPAFQGGADVRQVRDSQRVVGHGGTAADLRLEGRSRGFRDRMAQDSLRATLRKAGMKTVSISPFAERHSAWWFYAGFNEMHNTGKGGLESAEHVTPTALRWIEDNAKDDNWFLHINYWTHTLHTARPADFGNPFENDPLPEWLTEDTLNEHRTSRHRTALARSTCMTTRPAPSSAPSGRIGEHGRLATDDRRLRLRHSIHGRSHRRLFAALEEQGVFDDLVILISSDHGENIASWASTASTRPLTPSPAGSDDHPLARRSTGTCRRRIHYNLDLVPTLADLLDKPHAPTWDGRSYAPTIWSGYDAGREYLVISQCAHVCQRGVRFGDWMYVRTYHDGYHLSPRRCCSTSPPTARAARRSE